MQYENVQIHSNRGRRHRCRSRCGPSARPHHPKDPDVPSHCSPTHCAPTRGRACRAGHRGSLRHHSRCAGLRHGRTRAADDRRRHRPRFRRVPRTDDTQALHVTGWAANLVVPSQNGLNGMLDIELTAAPAAGGAAQTIGWARGAGLLSPAPRCSEGTPAARAEPRMGRRGRLRAQRSVEDLRPRVGQGCRDAVERLDPTRLHDRHTRRSSTGISAGAPRDRFVRPGRRADDPGGAARRFHRQLSMVPVPLRGAQSSGHLRCYVGAVHPGDRADRALPVVAHRDAEAGNDPGSNSGRATSG